MKTTKATLTELNKIMSRVSKDRDRLTDLKNEIDANAEALDEAYRCIEAAIDFLSEVV